MDQALSQLLAMNSLQLMAPLQGPMVGGGDEDDGEGSRKGTWTAEVRA